MSRAPAKAMTEPKSKAECTNNQEFSILGTPLVGTARMQRHQIVLPGAINSIVGSGGKFTRYCWNLGVLIVQSYG